MGFQTAFGFGLLSNKKVGGNALTFIAPYICCSITEKLLNKIKTDEIKFKMSQLNTKTIGFSGGGVISELGTAKKVQLFFDLINEYAVKKYPDQPWFILTDRLYKRYLRLDELDISIKLMNCVKSEFKKIKSTPPKHKANLNLSKNTLFDIFENFFKNFSLCVEMAKLSFEEFRNLPDYKYEPVRIVVTDQPWLLLETTRELEDYDFLDGSPFWK